MWHTPCLFWIFNWHKQFIPMKEVEYSYQFLQVLTLHMIEAWITSSS
jgi:hypothetical protein